MERSISIVCPNLSLDRTMRIETLAVGRIHRSHDTAMRGGGKGVNVARALGCIGVSASVVGFAGGYTGSALLRLLESEGINASGVHIEGEARSCLTVIDRAAITVFNEAGPTIGAADWVRFEESVDRWLGPHSVFVCSGSWPDGTPIEAAAHLIALARSKLCTTICDTSKAYLDAALSAAPDLIKPNLAEAETILLGHAEEPALEPADALERAIPAARALLERGPRAVVVSAGEAGSVLARPGETVVVRAPPVSLVNPVGAGDCFVAGLAAGMARNEDLAVSLRRATAMGAAGCETFVAGELDPQRAEELLTAL